MLYFDQTASTLPYEEVLDLYVRLSREHFANPSAMHRLGFAAEQVLKEARRSLAEDLSCSPDELIFTSGATESINTALRGYIHAHPHAGREIVTWAVEHKATLASCEALEKEGYLVHRLAVNEENAFDLHALEAVLSERTSLLSFSYVNNEVGLMLPLEQVLRLRDRLAPQAVLHIDAVQAWEKFPLRLQGSGIDMASFSGHKIHGPKGVGLLYLRKNLRIEPLIYGGGHQQGRRSGTENPILAACLAEAARIGHRQAGAHLRQVTELNRYLRQRLLEKIGGLVIHSPETASPYILNVGIPGIRVETLVHALAGREIYVATQSACSSKEVGSHVLEVMNLPEASKAAALRLSLDPEHRQEDLDDLVEALVEEVEKLRA